MTGASQRPVFQVHTGADMLLSRQAPLVPELLGSSSSSARGSGSTVAGYRLPALPIPETVGEQLGRLLTALMHEAGCHFVPAPAQAPDPPSLGSALDALHGASGAFDAGMNDGLAPMVWTNPSALRSGEIARRLSQNQSTGGSGQGFLVLLADDIVGPLVYLPRQSPIRVAMPVNGDLRPGGPYLVLVLCEFAGAGLAQLVEAYAVAVLDLRRFVPICANFVRDILRALLHLQATLDAHGCECTIAREPPLGPGGYDHVLLTLTPRGEPARSVRFAINPSADMGRVPVQPVAVQPGPGQPGPTGTDPDTFVATQANWEDGTFIAWLMHALSVPAPL